MSYRNEKREAAIWILLQIIKPKKAKVSGYVEKGVREEINYEKSYDDYELNDLTENSSYTKEVLREASELLLSKGHLDLFENFNDIYKCKIRCTKAGEIALKEEVYEEDIKNYNSDKYYRTSRWFIPGLALIISIVSICVTTCKKSSYTIQLQIPEEKGQQQPLKTSQSVIEKSDSTH